MKLTNTIRDAFVRAAMDDVPQIDYDPIIRKAVTEAVIAALPDVVRKAYKGNESYFETYSRRYGGINVHVPGYHRYANGGPFPKLSDATEIALGELGKKNTDQEASRKALEQKLRGAAYAATTRKALADMLPEFEKYLPPDEAAANRALPFVANIVADFVKAGWPKGGKKKPSIAA